VSKGIRVKKLRKNRRKPARKASEIFSNDSGWRDRPEATGCRLLGQRWKTLRWKENEQTCGVAAVAECEERGRELDENQAAFFSETTGR